MSRQFLLRINLALCWLLSALITWAQEFDDIDLNQGRRAADEFDSMGALPDYSPIRFGIDDVVLVVLLLVACYVFGKIWKGCSYLLLIVAALFYYLLRY